ncbi:MAG: protein kinase domain-containing protein [Myxococcales bacterium]|jgi:CRP-like cAMP-binding protein/tRNA A-37 threonylcarbamoyl transferase component Bud32
MAEGKRGLLSWMRGENKSQAPTEDERARVETATPSVALADRIVDQGVIAKGGMSTVRLAYDNNLLRHVAMKVLSPKIAAKPQEAQRFLEEAQITGQLEHPNIPPVHEVGIDDEGTHYFTMKYVRGITLEEMLTDQSFSVHDEAKLFEVLQVFVKTCQAIGYAHSRGVIHCDIKPRNVMVGSHGQVYVMDWGIARLIGTPRPSGAESRTLVEISGERARPQDEGRVMGTVGYMSPEQAKGYNTLLDTRSDVFQLGALLYRILTGRAPYITNTPQETLVLAAACQWTAPEVIDKHLPRRLCAIVAKAMALRPDDRYQTVEQLQKDVEAFMRGVGRYPTRTFKPGALIVEEGDTGNEAYVILEGRCRAFKLDVSGERRVLREMGRGVVFGEAAAFASASRTASVEAVNETTVAVITRESLANEIGPVAGPFVTALAERFHDIDERSTSLRLERDAYRLALEVMRYLNLRGEERDGARVAPWGPLARHLRERLEWNDAQALKAARRIEGITVDLAEDRIALAIPVDVDELYPPELQKTADSDFFPQAPQEIPANAEAPMEAPTVLGEPTIRTDGAPDDAGSEEGPKTELMQSPFVQAEDAAENAIDGAPTVLAQSPFVQPDAASDCGNRQPASTAGAEPAAERRRRG